MKANTTYNGQICKANTGRNTLLHLKYYRGSNPYAVTSETATVHDKINARSMCIVPNLKPFVN